MKRILAFMCALVFTVLLLPGFAWAEEAGQAKELSSRQLVTDTQNMSNPYPLFDGKETVSMTGKPRMSLTLESPEGIGSVYLIFDEPYESITFKSGDSGSEKVWNSQGFLHEFVDVQELLNEVPHALTLSFGEKAPVLNELRVFTEGEPPADVQRWKLAPEEGVDLLLFPTHGDDEQLFFAGMLPYYAGELQYEVQVAYFTDHGNLGRYRRHEMLDGLWTVGVTNYPVFGSFPDTYSHTEKDAETGIELQGFHREEVLQYVVEQLRRFKPLVAVGHDLEGEYGHGAHRLYARILTEAVEQSMDPAVFPESAKKYGVWDVPKTYLHLYPENPIHMNWDIPLDRFNGMTAFEVSRDLGFPAHATQYNGFSHYYADSTSAETVKQCGPCDFGLYRTTVGEDREKDDLFENLVPRKQKKQQQEQAAAEEQARQEEADREEQRWKEAAAEAAQKEEARQAQEQQKAVEAAAREQAQSMTVVASAAGVILLLAVAAAVACVVILVTRKE